MRVAGLVLAGGAGTRFGRPKALLTVDGRRFVDLAIDALREGGADPVLVVIGATGVGHVDALVVDNDRWAEGMGSSLGAGLVALEAYGERVGRLDGVVVALVDQPRIAAEAVARVLAAARSGAYAAVATYGAEHLHPVFLHVASWPAVAEQLHGDRGARQFLQANAARVELVACDGLGDPSDVDTPEDLSRLG